MTKQMEGTLWTKDYRHFEVRGGGGYSAADALAIFEGAKMAGNAFLGDTVVWNGERVTEIKARAGAAKPLFLVGTLELTSKVRYGLTSRGVPIYSFVPFSEAYPPFFVGCSRKDTTRNLLTKIQFENWSSDSTCPRGVLVHTYGAAGNLEAEEAALLDHYAPVRWGRGDEAAAAAAVAETPHRAPIPAAAPTSAFHIDPPGCRDIDDAITVERGAQLRVGIHIADVASWLRAQPQMLEKALKIGQTLYKDGVAVRPLFPAQYSEDALSLLPGKVRRALTLWFVWIPEARCVDPDSFAWEHTWIEVKESYTYETAYSSEHAYILEEIASYLVGYKVEDSHGWIEQLMILYNTEAARLLVKHGVGVLRRHAAPDMERLHSLEEIGLGDAARLLSMRSGEYCSANCSATEEVRKHWGLQVDEYCQITSPIRRCVDSLNQMCLMRLLGFHERDAAAEVFPVAELNEHARRAKAYERDRAFLAALLTTGEDGSNLREVTGVVVAADRVWIEEWKRLYKWRDSCEHALVPGMRLRLKVFYDAGQRNWKRRMVLQIVPAKIELAS
jgi:exoribonuclease R